MSSTDAGATPIHDPDEHIQRHRPKHRDRWVLGSITALGVVYGDIGTSPLYAFQQALASAGDGGASPQVIMGIVSLIFWAIVMVVAVKYVTVVMRADNEGEGGILALLALVTAKAGLDRKGLPRLLMLGVIGAAFIYGDGIITPAISVLSAMEGLKVAAPSLGHWVLPLTVAILVLLFLIQSQGTGTVGGLFGPVMIVWFVVIGLLGLSEIVARPAILAALDPAYAISFLAHGGRRTFVIVGSVFLVLTGAEALYADMGHVGAPAVRRAWFGLVLPCLALSYLGQGAAVLGNAAAAKNPFFEQAPDWAGIPLVILSAAATIIASQALISGAFSMTRQAIQMRLWPRMIVKPTSGHNAGQIYIGVINWMLMAGTIAVVLAFKTSDSLGSAYGIAVSGTMLVTSILLHQVMVQKWKWSQSSALIVAGGFAAIDLTFLAANSTKFMDGGWFPLAVGGVLALMMLTWRSGTIEVQRCVEDLSLPFDEFLQYLDANGVSRVPGTAVVLTRSAHQASPILVQQVKHFGVLHEHVILMTIQPVHRPVVPARDRIEITEIGRGFVRVTVRLGFMQTPDLGAYVRNLVSMGLACAKDDIHYVVAYEHVARRARKPHFPAPLWHIFSLLSKTGVRLTDFMAVPEKHVFEVGIKVRI